MSLANLLKKGSLRGFATATPATPATHSPFNPRTVATVATVAVANAQNPAANDPTPKPKTATDPETPVRIGLVRSEVRTETAVSSNEVSKLVSTETAVIGGTFTARLARFTAKGVIHTDGEALANKLATRDRESDDRRLCLECTHLAGHAGHWSCRNWQRAGIALQARDAGLPGDLVRLLQRCDGFTNAINPI